MPTDRPRHRITAIASLCAILLAACAGGSDDPATPTTRDRPAPSSTTATTAPVTTTTAGAPGLGDPARVRTDGIGRLKWGMTTDEATAALRVDLDETPPLPAPEPGAPQPPTPPCRSYTVAGGPPDVRLVFWNGKLSSAFVTGPSVTTRSGLGVGSTDADVLAATEGRNRVVAVGDDPDPATPQRPRRIVWFPDPADDDVRIVFESDGATVTRFWAGRIPTVAYPDGCANAPQPG